MPLLSTVLWLIVAVQVVINAFPSERLLVLRERAAGTYYASAYFMAKITAETATQLPIPIIFSAIVYWLVGLQPTASKFVIFTAFMMLCNLAGKLPPLTSCSTDTHAEQQDAAFCYCQHSVLRACSILLDLSCLSCSPSKTASQIGHLQACFFACQHW